MNQDGGLYIRIPRNFCFSDYFQASLALQDLRRPLADHGWEALQDINKNKHILPDAKTV